MNCLFLTNICVFVIFLNYRLDIYCTILIAIPRSGWYLFVIESYNYGPELDDLKIFLKTARKYDIKNVLFTVKILV